MLIGLKFRVKLLKSHLRVTNKMIVTWCYWKFNTEVAISEFFEKLCHLIIDQRQNKKNLHNLLI